jgi:hypothetical protein
MVNRDRKESQLLFQLEWKDYILQKSSRKESKLVYDLVCEFFTKECISKDDACKPEKNRKCVKNIDPEMSENSSTTSRSKIYVNTITCKLY